jgi:hypothetical protein
VSGTPPEALIKQTPTLVAGTAVAGFYRHDPQDVPFTAASPGVREGYAWGGLTSGTRITSALRLLLLPFSLVNVAGWMVPGVRADDGAPTHPPLGEHGVSASMARRVAWHMLVTRLLAACLTVFVTAGAVWIGTTAARFAAEKYTWGFTDDGVLQAKLALGGVLVLGAAWVWSAKRRARMPKDGAMSQAKASQVAADAVARAPLANFDVSQLWQITDTTKRLSGIHWALSISTAVVLTNYALNQRFPLALALALASLTFGVLGLFALRGQTELSDQLTAVVRRTALPLAAFAAAALFATSGGHVTADGMTENVLKAVAFAAACIWAAVTALLVAQYAIGPGGGPPIARLHAGAFTVVGFGTAVTGIVGLALITTYWLKGRLTLKVDPILGAMARSIAIVGFLSVCVLIAIVLVQLRVLRGPTGVERFMRLRSAVEHARGAIVASAIVFGAGAAATVIAALFAARMEHDEQEVRGVLGSLEHNVGWAKYGWIMIAIVVAAVVAASFVEPMRARIVTTVIAAFVLLGVLALVVVGYAAWIAHTDVSTALGHFVTNSARWFVIVAVAGAFLTPAAGVVAYIGWGSRDQGLRRSVGIFWDLVDFWPRQFHPWAPPPYTDTTIPELSDRVGELVKTSDGATVVVSAHSQGAIIAVPALGRLNAYGGLTEEQSSRVSLVTYGQLLDCHYRWLFPWIFNPTMFTQVDTFLGHRWINLFRVTDPLGQPVPALDTGEGVRNIKIDTELTMRIGTTSAPKTLNHGDYWYSQPQYQNALFSLALRED